MTRHTIRGYTVSLGLLGLAGAWTAVGRAPWPTAADPATPAVAVAAPAATGDPAIASLRRRVARVRRLAARVRAAERAQRAAAALPPIVRIVDVPATAAPAAAPVVQTRSS